MRDRPRLRVMRAVADRCCAGQLDALLAQVVTLQTRLVGGGEHVARDVVASAFDRSLCERDDRYPMIGAESLGDLREARQPPGGDVQVSDVLKRRVGLVAETVAFCV